MDKRNVNDPITQEDVKVVSELLELEMTPEFEIEMLENEVRYKVDRIKQLQAFIEASKGLE